MIDVKYVNLALEKLTPNGAWTIAEDFLLEDKIIWLSKNVEKPSWDIILSESKNFKVIEISTNYKKLRQAEYPPIEDYLDAVVKNDLVQVEAYIAKCKEIKLKYPKTDIDTISALNYLNNENQ